MNTSQVNQVHGSVANRASQLQAFLQHDIFFEKNSLLDAPEEKAFLFHYFRKWGAFNQCHRTHTTWDALVDNVPWSDWYDRW